MLAFERTGLGEELYKMPHVGGTVFAPNNWAFKKLGPGPNAFLFSKPGRKYLKALLKYHLSPNVTVYSDQTYDHKGEQEEEGRPRRNVHIDLPTLLDDRSLPIDLIRLGPLINFRVNGYVHVAVKNGIAKDGVIHIPSSVLIPPKTRSGSPEEDEYRGGEICVEGLKRRLEPYLDEKDSDDSDDFDDVKWEV
jgi:hypothetical protein